jgi:hypothetical protein
MLVLGGIVDGSLLMSYNHTLSQAARDGARIGAATLEDPPADGSEIEFAAETFALAALTNAGIDPASVSVDAEWFQDEGVSWLRLQIVGEYVPFLPGISPFGGTRTHEFVVLTQEQL